MYLSLTGAWLSCVYQASPSLILLLGITVALTIAGVAVYLLLRNTVGRGGSEERRIGNGDGGDGGASDTSDGGSFGDRGGAGGDGGGGEAVYEVAGSLVHNPLGDARGPVS